MKKRGVFFSGDALFAMMILFFVLLIIVVDKDVVKHDTEVHLDVLNSLSTLKVRDVDNSYVESLISSGAIKDLDKSLLEQIGEFSVTDIGTARNLATAVLADLDLSENIGIWYGTTLIFSSNKTAYENATFVKTARHVLGGISGDDENESVTGFSARAFFSSNRLSKYYYFGGYVGDGNITMNIHYDGNITNATLEAVIRNNFEIYVNGILIGNFLGSVDEFTPISYELPIDEFISGDNLIEFRGDLLHAAGGFLKITYVPEVGMQFPNRYSFPGIDGLINLYDSIYVPATLTGLDISLHVNSSASPLFLNIGNVTVFNRTTNDKELISINDATLSSILDYDSLSKRTIPIRLGLENVSFVGITKEIDVFSVTDLSWSMNGQMMTDAKSANNLLIDILLNNQGNRVGLVGYESLARDSDFHLLSSNSASLKSVISNQWNAGGQTCICCGINKATTYFISPLGSMSGGSIQSRVSTSNDDAEERVSDGDMTRNSQELELVYDIYNGGDQFVGMRFGNINIPAGATIVNAHIEFISKQTNSGVTHLTFSAEDIDSASSFSNSNYDISSRQKTNSQVNWSNVPSWNFGEIYQTPDLSGMIQEVVDRAGWSNGNSVVVIVNGSGQRTAFSFNSAGGAFAPLLVINYSLAPLTCGNGIIDVGEECDDGNSNNNDACTNLCTDAVCGDGAVWNLGGSEQCDDGGICTGDDFTLCIKDSDCSVVGGVCTQRNGDGCSISCQTEDRFKSMVVMSDGNANVECLEQNTGNAGRDAIEAACTAWNTYGIQVNAVGFGSEANESTLQAIAVCGNGSYYFSDVAGLGEVYEQIANQIIASYTEQTLKVEGDLQSRLFEDSYIDFTYNKPPFPTGLVLSLESNFSDSFSGSFSVPDDSIVIETRATSYSGPRWTDNFEVDGNSVYALSDYGSSYASLGDPFIVNMPNSLATTGIHFVNLTTGVAPGNSSNGSIYNKVIVTIVKNASSFSEIKPVAKGCVWSIEFLGGGTTSINIPGAYTGSSVCSYNSLSISYDPNDAFQEAAFILLSRLDFDSNGIVDFAFVEDDLSFSLDEVTGIPFTWSSEVHARIWY